MAFDSIRTKLARLIAPRRQRQYAAARYSRLTSDWAAATGSADSELWSSLARLRDRSRQLIRDNAYAKRAQLLVVNNVIGGGVGLEPQVKNADGSLNDKINKGIAAAFAEWSRAENCHTGGALNFADLERQIFMQIFEAGEVFPRKHPQKFGSSKVPLAIELIESERLADDFVAPAEAGPNYRMGIERDEFGRATAFWIRQHHPGEFRYVSADVNKVMKIGAEFMFHLYQCDRWPQTRGVPWLHAAMRRLNDMDGYSEAEIVRARAAACRMGFIQTPDVDGLPNDNTDPNGQPLYDFEPGMVQRLGPGEEWVDSNPSAPNAAAEPFLQLLLREVAAGIGVSYASMSMDYSQSNYSSSRLALLDDRDLWRVFQQWYIRAFREPLHREWIRQAVLAGAIPQISVTDYIANPSRFEACMFEPRGWNWIDPEKEVNAVINARRAGLSSLGMIASQFGNGTDYRDVLIAIAEENKLADSLGLVLTSDAGQILARGESDPNKEAEQALATAKVAHPPGQQQPSSETKDLTTSVARAIEQMAGMTAMVAERKQEPTVVNIAPQPVHINTPDVKVNVESPKVDVHLPEQPITVNSPDVNVQVDAPAAPSINIEAPKREEFSGAEVIERDGNRMAKVIRTNRGDLEVVSRDDNGDIKSVRRIA